MKTNQLIEKKRCVWLYLPLVIFIEWLLFTRYAMTHIIDFYPTGFDQASYLPMLYDIYEHIKSEGFLRGIANAPLLATGILFPIQINLAFFILGASRYSALLVNFVYFVLLQVTCIFTMNSLRRDRYLIFAILGVLLALKTPFLGNGGMFDVRIDFLIFCLFGIFTCFVIKSSFFLNRQWTIVSIFVALITILMRTLTITYFIGIAITFGLYLYLDHDRGKRFTNVLLFTLGVSTLSIPLLWINRDVLYNYYVVGHVLSSEKYIRFKEVGITGFFSALWYYPQMLINNHVGEKALFLIGMLILPFAFLTIIYPKIKFDKEWKIGFICLSIIILIPTLILTLDTSKSPVVASVMVVPLLWIFFWYIIYINSKYCLTTNFKKTIKIITFIILGAGLLILTKNATDHLSKRRFHTLTSINQMYADIGNYLVSKKWSHATISFNYINDYLTSGSIATYYYEITGKYLSIATSRLGGSIFAITKDEALSGLKSAEIVILDQQTDTPASFYPFNESVRRFYPDLKLYAEANFRILGDYRINNRHYRVYVIS